LPSELVFDEAREPVVAFNTFERVIVAPAALVSPYLAVSLIPVEVKALATKGVVGAVRAKSPVNTSPLTTVAAVPTVYSPASLNVAVTVNCPLEAVVVCALRLEPT